MKAALKLVLVTPTRTLVDTEVAEVSAPGTVGEFGVLPQHTTFLGRLGLGVLSYVERGTKRCLLIDGGYAEVRDDVVTVLADEARLATEIDTAEVELERRRLERQIETGDHTLEETDALLHAIRKAEASLEAAS